MIHIDELREYCLSKDGATEDFPFDNVTLVFKVRNKMFCLAGLEKWEQGNKTINVKCDPDTAIQLREKYDGTVIGGWHSNKKHWNTIDTDRDMPPAEVFKWIDHSYDCVVAGLTRKERLILRALTT